MGELDNVQLRSVDSVDDAQEFLTWLGERRSILAIDSETVGLEWWVPNFVRLVQVGDQDTGWALSVRDWRALIRIALERYDGPVCFHNATFDLHALESAGLPLPAAHRVNDTLTLHHLLDPPAAHGLKKIAADIWKGADAGDRLLKKAFHDHGWNWATVPEEFPAYRTYSALDTVLTARLYERFAPEVRRTGMWPAYEREMAYAVVMHRCERRGLRIDSEYAVRLRDFWAQERERLSAELLALGVENPGSSRQVFKALEDGGFDPSEFTPTGEPKLDKTVMNEIIRELGVPADIASRVMQYRRIVKWSAAYLDAFLGNRADDQGFAHPNIRTLGARTGRSSITGPPLQTLPRGAAIRHCVLPKEGESLFCVDYDAQELRMFAHYSADPALQRIFQEGTSPHARTAQLVYGLPLDQCGKGTAVYDTAKNVRYARLYGAGVSRMAATASASTVAGGGVPVTALDIESFIAGLDREFPGETAFIRYVDEIARTRLADYGRGYVTTYGGRFMPGDPDKLYALVNYLVQGSCADILKSKCNALEAAGYGDWIMLPVHDELLFSVPAGAEGEMETVRQIMEEHQQFSVPLTCEVKGPFDRWGRAYE